VLWYNFWHLANEGKTAIEVMLTENAWNTEAAAEFPGERTTESKRRQYAMSTTVYAYTLGKHTRI
jgi:hypothetical protein